MIVPNDGKTVFHALPSPGGEKDETAEADDVLKFLMTAYKNYKTISTKTQILSLYAYKYSVSTFKKLHSPYGKLSTRQIQGTIGPSQVPEEKIHHRGRIGVTNVDHFVEFINRPYFSQDVSYGTKFLNLDSGETIEIPNEVRTVKRSTMISQYIKFCQKEKFEPLSRTTLI